MNEDLKVRTFRFAVDVVALSNECIKRRVSSVLLRQLLSSGTSVGATVEEAVAACSRGDFAHKMNIALKEARETNYWLRLLQASHETRLAPYRTLLEESSELMKILGSIVVKVRRNP